jgi:uncharacterized protein YijF (DUF1287 family)
MTRTARTCLNLLLWSAFVVACGRVRATPTDRVAPSASGERAANSAQRVSSQSATALGVRDTGIFSDLDAQLQLTLPPGLETLPLRAAVDRARGQLVLYAADRPIKVYPLAGTVRLDVAGQQLQLRAADRAELAPLLARARLYVFDQRVELPPGDTDDDGIPDPLDVLLGARKVALNADRYDGRYERIAYPGGDVPRAIGVCTDVVIRAWRNAGFDLQRAVHEDILRAPAAYPGVKRSDPNIDHRRIKTLLPYFLRHQEPRSTNLHDARDPLRPGDVVFMDTFPTRPGAEHVGIVSDTIDPSGLPLVINNWTEGTVSRPMELLSWVPVTHRFRVPARLLDRGPLPALKTQLLSVVSDGWSDAHATLARYERAPGQSWRAVGSPLPAVLGRAGYGWGDGLHGRGAPDGRSGPRKREGDGRSPAGVFEFGTTYGYAEPTAGLPNYVTATAAHRCVDDPNSKHYNRVVSTAATAVDFVSAEQMRRDDNLYELAIEIEHNRAPIEAGRGSCIFLHVWAGPGVPVSGCTGIDKVALSSIARWLERDAALLVALPKSEYAALRASWGLP